MKLFNLFVIFSFLVVSKSSFSQENANALNDQYHSISISEATIDLKSKMAKKGTYQFIIKTTKVEFGFANEVYERIESERDEAEIKTIYLNPMVDVVILPKNAVASKDFVPLDEYLYLPE